MNGARVVALTAALCGIPGGILDAPSARAQDTTAAADGSADDQVSDEQRALAVRLGREGVALYNEQRFEDALDRFTNAEAIVHSPVFVVYMARIERKRGNWRKARRLFDSVLGETLRDDAPVPWQSVHQEASLERERLIEAMPSVRIGVSGHDRDGVSVWIDGEMIEDWHRGPVFVDPGKHQIVGQFGATSASTRVEVVAGQKAVPVELVFSAPPTLPITHTPAPLLPSPHGPDDTDETTGQHIAGYSLLGIGGVAALASLGVGIGVLVKNGEISDQCLDGSCPEALTDAVAALDDLNRATLGLGIAGAALLITGWIVAGTASSTSDSEGAHIGLSPAGLGGTYRW